MKNLLGWSVSVACAAPCASVISLAHTCQLGLAIPIPGEASSDPGVVDSLPQNTCNSSEYSHLPGPL
jgi:hypothetical protein